MTDDQVLLENGEYNAQVMGTDSVYENQNGTLVARFNVMIGTIDRAAFVCLTKKDGSPNKLNLDKLKGIFPDWDGDPSWFLDDNNVRGAECIVTVINEGGWSNVTDIKPANWSGSEKEVPPSVDGKVLRSKYAGKFRAMLGGTPVKPMTTPKPINKQKTAKADDDGVPF